MTPQALVAPALFVILPLSAATGILGAHTIGEAIYPRDTALIGFALALLVFSGSSYLLVLRPAPAMPDARFGIVLAASGALCILVALALQFYVASIAADNSRRASEILAERLRANQPQVNVNVNASIPPSVQGVSYLALFAGVWLVILGVRFGMGRPAHAVGPPDRATHSQPLYSERIDMPDTGIRPS